MILLLNSFSSFLLTPYELISLISINFNISSCGNPEEIYVLFGVVIQYSDLYLLLEFIQRISNT